MKMIEKMEKTRQTAGQLVHDVNPTKTHQTNAFLTDSNFEKDRENPEDGRNSADGRPTGT